MKVYIASPYERKATINRQIYEELTRANIEAFLPEKININTSLEKTKEQYKGHVVNYYYIDDDDNAILISTINSNPIKMITLKQNVDKFGFIAV